MSYRPILVAAAVVLVLSSVQHGSAGKNPPTTSPSDDQSQARGRGKPSRTVPAGSRTVVYRPPKRGAPVTRVGGGTRAGENDTLPAVAVLTPEHTGLTTQPQPVLFWHISKPTKHPIKVVLVPDEEPDPLLEIVLEGGATAGIHRLDLSEHAVELEKGREYTWSVAVAVPSTPASQHPFASGRIKRINLPPEVEEKFRAADGPLEGASVYAAEGIWYDALAALDQPQSSDEFAPARKELLAQVKLRESDGQIFDVSSE